MCRVSHGWSQQPADLFCYSFKEALGQVPSLTLFSEPKGVLSPTAEMTSFCLEEDWKRAPHYTVRLLPEVCRRRLNGMENLIHRKARVGMFQDRERWWEGRERWRIEQQNPHPLPSSCLHHQRQHSPFCLYQILDWFALHPPHSNLKKNF